MGASTEVVQATSSGIDQLGDFAGRQSHRFFTCALGCSQLVDLLEGQTARLAATRSMIRTARRIASRIVSPERFTGAIQDGVGDVGHPARVGRGFRSSNQHLVYRDHGLVVLSGQAMIRFWPRISRRASRRP